MNLNHHLANDITIWTDTAFDKNVLSLKVKPLNVYNYVVCSYNGLSIDHYQVRNVK